MTNTTPPPAMPDDLREVVEAMARHAYEDAYPGKPWGMADEDVEAIFAENDAKQQRLAVAMPTDHDALRVMAEAMARLGQLGWRDPVYCPKDGSTFDVIEAGSMGIHKAHYMGDWPEGSWWIHDAGDLWPSRPILWRPHLKEQHQ